GGKPAINCPQGEIKKLEIELWNLKVKENNVSAYTERFQELTLISTKFVADETEKIVKYVSELPDNIYGSVKASKPKTLDETIELANDLMDQKLHTYAERQSNNKRKADESFRNNHGHQQQTPKRQNVARVYNMGTGERRSYSGNLPKNNGENLKGNGCFVCGATWHFKRDCPKLKNKDGKKVNAPGWVQTSEAVANMYNEWGQKLKDTDSDATLYSSSSYKIEKSANETDDSDESDIDLFDDNLYKDNNAARPRLNTFVLEVHQIGPSKHFSKRQGIWTSNALKWRVQGSLQHKIPEGLRRNILQQEMSHHTLYGVKPLLLYAATFKFTRDDLSKSALRHNIGDKGNVGSQSKYRTNLKWKFREDTFSENKNDDAHEHVKRVLDIVSLFNILRVSHDAVMLRVFPITLTGAAKRWVDRLPLRTVKSCDLFKKSFIQRNIKSSSSSEGITAIVNKLENLGRDMKKLKENVHAIQVGCQICKEASREAQDKIIQGLETKAKTLANEVERRTNNEKFKECEAICTEDGLPLYTPFYYSFEEIEYFSTNSVFLDNEKQETDNSGMTKALAALKATLKKNKEELKKEKQNINYYVDPYKPQIPFPGQFEQHAKETLVLNDWMRIRYGKVCKMTGERILKDYWREGFGDEEDDLEENLEDLEECGEDKENKILGVIHDKLNNDWFNNTSEDENDLEGILDYSKPRSYDRFIDLDDEA
nr:hypothetical protein [Tanacetum cinerariifolium]